MTTPTVRTQDEYVPLTETEFRERFFARFYDPAFDAVKDDLERVFAVAWDGYVRYRKSPRTRPAGPGFADPAFELAVEWLATRAHIQEAQARFADPASPTRILLVLGSTRSEHTCPGEISRCASMSPEMCESDCSPGLCVRAIRCMPKWAKIRFSPTSGTMSAAVPRATRSR